MHTYSRCVSQTHLTQEGLESMCVCTGGSFLILGGHGILKSAAQPLGERGRLKARATEKRVLIGLFTLVHAMTHMGADLGSVP